MTIKTSKWSRIILVAGLVIGLMCCLAVGAYWLFTRTMDTVGHASNPWVRSLAWSPNGSQLAVGSADHSITIWDVKSAKLLLTIAKNTASVRELAWSPDGTMLASGAQNGVIYIWNPLTGEPVEQLTKENEQDALGFLDWSPDGSFLAYTGAQGSIMGWDIARKQKTFFAQSKSGLALGITGISWSPDDTRLATSSTDGTITAWDRLTGNSIWTVSAHKGWANDVDWSPNGSLLASGGDDALLKVWAAKTGKLVNQNSGADQIFSIAWSPKANQIAWGSDAGKVTITDFTDAKKPDVNLKTGTGQVWVVAWSRDGQQLAAGTDANTVFVWDAATGQQIQLLTLPTP